MQDEQLHELLGRLRGRFKAVASMMGLLQDYMPREGELPHEAGVCMACKLVWDIIQGGEWVDSDLGIFLLRFETFLLDEQDLYRLTTNHH